MLPFALPNLCIKATTYKLQALSAFRTPTRHNIGSPVQIGRANFPQSARTAPSTPLHLPQLPLADEQSSKPSVEQKRDSKQPEDLQPAEQQVESNKDDTATMDGEAGKQRKAHALNAQHNPAFKSTAGSRGSISPTPKPPVIVHNSSGLAPPDEPSSRQKRSDRYH